MIIVLILMCLAWLICGCLAYTLDARVYRLLSDELSLLYFLCAGPIILFSLSIVVGIHMLSIWYNKSLLSKWINTFGDWLANRP